MKTKTNTNVITEKGKDSRLDLLSDKQGYDTFLSQCVKNSSLRYNYNIARAIECIAAAGQRKAEDCEIHDAIQYLKDAQSEPLWRYKFEQALQEWQLDKNLKLALIYIFCATNVSNGFDHIASAIRCLEDRLVSLDKQETAVLTTDQSQSQNLSDRITASDINGSKK